MIRRRWDIDERGHGIGPGDAFAPHVAELAEAMSDRGWVTEDPKEHLLPHLLEACDESGSVLRLESARSIDGIFVVELSTRERECSLPDLRRAAVALAGSIAEDSTHIRQRSEGDVVEFDVATGTLASETPYAPHGHLVRLRIRRPA